MIAKGTYEWSLGVRNNGRSRTTCNSPVVLPSEYRSVEDFCNRIHRTLFKSFKHLPRGIPCRLGYRAINWRGYHATVRHAAGAIQSAVRPATMHADTWSGDGRRGVQWCE
jgi:hypothetical protein